MTNELTENRNRIRADRAGHALDHVDYLDDDDRDLETAIVDLLTDLMHLAQLEAVDWPGALAQATEHHQADRQGTAEDAERVPRGSPGAAARVEGQDLPLRDVAHLGHAYVALLDRLLPVEDADRGKRGKGPKKRRSTVEAEMKSRVSLVRRNFYDREPVWDGVGIPPAGGTDPAEYWARKDEYEAALKRPARKMGRKFDG